MHFYVVSASPLELDAVMAFKRASPLERDVLLVSKMCVEVVARNRSEVARKLHETYVR